MARLSPEDEATLKRLIAQRDAPDEGGGGEVYIRDGSREYKVTGSTADRVLAKLFGDDPPGGKPPPKKAAAKKAAPPPPAEEDPEGEEGEEDPEGEEGEETDPPTGAKKHWYFGG